MSDLLDLAYPGRCVICQGPADGATRLCEDCDVSLKALEDAPQCLHCGAPVAVEDSPCQRCEGRGYRLFDCVVRLSVFDDPVRQLVHRLKFYHGWSVGELFAQRAMRVRRVRSLLADADVLVPVPLHPWRHVTRGFNQADVFATRLANLAGLRVAHPAIRLRRTPAQSLQTSRLARVKNLRNAFALISGRSVRDLRVVLVDDVMTTGSTLKSFAQVIKDAKPASMSVLTIAVADHKDSNFQRV